VQHGHSPGFFWGLPRDEQVAILGLWQAEAMDADAKRQQENRATAASGPEWLQALANAPEGRR
jgi:hypothetical protein